MFQNIRDKTYSSSMDVSGHNHIFKNKVKKYPRLFSAAMILILWEEGPPSVKKGALMEYEKNFQNTCFIQQSEQHPLVLIYKDLRDQICLNTSWCKVKDGNFFLP